MSNFLQENKRSFYIIFGLFLLIAIVIYFLFVHPLLGDISRKESAIESKRDQVEQLEKQIRKAETATKTSNVEELLLTRVVPETRQLDEYILELQKLEYRTNSIIETINFAYDSAISNHEVPEEVEGEEQSDEDASAENEPEQTEEAEDKEKESDSEDADDEKAENDEEEEEEIPLFVTDRPEGLEVLGLTVVALSPTYEDFIDLLEVIESLERVTIVNSLAFVNEDEQKLFFDEEYEGYIPFTINISTFYYPEN